MATRSRRKDALGEEEHRQSPAEPPGPLGLEVNGDGRAPWRNNDARNVPSGPSGLQVANSKLGSKRAPERGRNHNHKKNNLVQMDPEVP